MEATRFRFGSVLEWVFAAVIVAGAVALASFLLSEVPKVRAVMPLSAREAPAHATPAAVPPGAVSVPVLHLADGREVRIGDTVSGVTAHLGPAARASAETIERTAAHEDLTRVYEAAGTRFVLLFDTDRNGGEPRVAAIYLNAAR